MPKPWAHLGHRFDTLDSTMAEARRLGDAGAPHGTWVVAGQQTQGRGRRGRTWQSEAKSGVYLTLLLRPDAQMPLTGLPLVFGLAAYEAVQSLWPQLHKAPAQVGDRPQTLSPSTLGLKWPNDLLACGRKLGGILVEADALGTAQAQLRVGIGLNVARRQSLKLHGEVAARYIGLMDLGDASRGDDRAATAAAAGLSRATELRMIDTCTRALLTTCHAGYTTFCAEGLGPTVAAWQAKDVLLGQAIEARLGARPICGRAQGIGADGRLRLVTAAGRVLWVDAGEVQQVGDASNMPYLGTNLTQDGPCVYVGLTPERF